VGSSAARGLSHPPPLIGERWNIENGPRDTTFRPPSVVAREGERTPRAAIYLNFRKFLVQYIKTCYMKRRGHALFVFLSSDEGIRVWLFSIAWVVHRVGQLEMLLRASALS